MKIIIIINNFKNKNLLILNVQISKIYKYILNNLK